MLIHYMKNIQNYKEDSLLLKDRNLEDNFSKKKKFHCKLYKAENIEDIEFLKENILRNSLYSQLYYYMLHNLKDILYKNLNHLVHILSCIEGSLMNHIWDNKDNLKSKIHMYLKKSSENDYLKHIMCIVNHLNILCNLTLSLNKNGMFLHQDNIN